MRIAVSIFALIAAIVLSTAFAKKQVKTQGEMMQDYIEERLEQKRAEEWRKCAANTIKDAERYVDSIIYQKVNFNISDSLRTPGKPLKPTRPFDTLRLDSTPIKPILDSSKVVN
jgi:hypothetical protein